MLSERAHGCMARMFMYMLLLDTSSERANVHCVAETLVGQALAKVAWPLALEGAPCWKKIEGGAEKRPDGKVTV